MLMRGNNGFPSQGKDMPVTRRRQRSPAAQKRWSTIGEGCFGELQRAVRRGSSTAAFVVDVVVVG